MLSPLLGLWHIIAPETPAPHHPNPLSGTLCTLRTLGRSPRQRKATNSATNTVTAVSPCVSPPWAE